ncbi:MAG: protein-glutamate O-methyltransferase CheR, partial [Deltaproteobacteria bacterium]|nr:protein-glutamate O-methyltransferase CheR [Deltaproteobacteria bacterium]
MTKIAPDELKVISTYIYNVSSIYLDQSKAYLLESRLKGLLEELGCDSY